MSKRPGMFVWKALALLGLCLGVRGCITNTDCDDGRHCCKAHCTSAKIQCEELCNRDEDCSRDQLCTQHVCVACSKRYNCELKSCFNDTQCPDTHHCKNHMCSEKDPPKKSFSLLPFIIIISVLGFALLVLCYTEGCWKEIILFVKRRTDRYGSLARDECEADRRELGESESRNHVHNNKSCVDPQRLTNSTTQPLTNPPTSSDTNSPNTPRNTLVVSQNDGVRTTTLTPSQRLPIPAYTAPSCCQQSLCISDAGTGPSLSTITTADHLLPTYYSLFDEELEEPPPKYEEVVNNITNSVYIEMQSLGVARSSSNQQNETTV